MCASWTAGVTFEDNSSTLMERVLFHFIDHHVKFPPIKHESRPSIGVGHLSLQYICTLKWTHGTSFQVSHRQLYVIRLEICLEDAQILARGNTRADKVDWKSSRGHLGGGQRLAVIPWGLPSRSVLLKIRLKWHIGNLCSSRWLDATSLVWATSTPFTPSKVGFYDPRSSRSIPKASTSSRKCVVVPSYGRKSQSKSGLATICVVLLPRIARESSESSSMD